MSKYIGDFYENIACKIIQKTKTLVCTNWHCFYGEIDIIAKKHGVTYFYEVRFRSISVFDKSKFLTYKKLSNIFICVNGYCKKHYIKNYKVYIVVFYFLNKKLKVSFTEVSDWFE